MSSDPKEGSLAYRPEIDGLRAVAVCAVLLFHAKLGVPGGFVGVDIFFVLSGFLITSLILKDYASADGFSILTFWERRIRRIIPALLLVILCTAWAGWFILLPSHYLDLGRSVLAQAVFGGNFYFWSGSGYFADSSITKPLLHTWSLAVEEQFYLLFPLLFLLGRKFSRPALRWIFGTLFFASLGLSLVQVRTAPDAAFYLLPSRAWELLAGSLLALAPAPVRRRPRMAAWVAWAGLVGIGAAFLGYTPTMPFPGLAAALPVFGTVAILWGCGCPGNMPLAGRFLSARPMVFLGKISYSLYLWHWPVLIYAAYWKDNYILRWPVRVGLLGMSVALAVLSWRWIETPFRKRQFLSRRNHLLTFGLVLPAACALVGALLILTQGAESRFPTAVVRVDQPRWSRGWNATELTDSTVSLESTLASAAQGQFASVGPTNAPLQCLVWGDSHAMALVPGFKELSHEFGVRVEFATHPATCPVLGYESFNRDSLKGDSTAWCQRVVEQVKARHIANVLLAANWPWYYCHGGPKNDFKFDPPTAQAFSRKLANTTTALKSAGATVWIFSRVPVQPLDFRKHLIKSLLAGRPAEVGVLKSECLRIADDEARVFESAVLGGARVLDPLPVFFTNRETCQLEASGEWLYRDDNHVSPAGARLLEGVLRPVFVR